MKNSMWYGYLNTENKIIVLRYFNSDGMNKLIKEGFDVKGPFAAHSVRNAIIKFKLL
jgi:hypothetical protein